MLRTFFSFAISEKVIHKILLGMLMTMFCLVFLQNISIKYGQQFVYLADSFLKGRLDFQKEHERFLTMEIEGGNIFLDVAEFNDKLYWPLGPFPAVLLLPVVFFLGTWFLQGYLSFPLTLLSFYLLFKIALKLNFRKSDAIWLASSFIFGSSYLFLASISAYTYFANVIAFTLILLSLFEYLGKKRYLLIGAYLALAIATHLNLILASLFFILAIIRSDEDLKTKLRDLFRLMLPIFVIGGFLLLYNRLRFGTPFETGYNLQTSPPVLAAARSAGLFNLKHLPGNLFFLLFSGPLPVQVNPGYYVLKYPFITFNPWGMSIFFTSPILVYLFLMRWRDKIVKIAIISFLFALFPILLYYGIGIYQVGYRYAVPLYPFLYLILAKALAPKLTIKPKMLIAIGIILNWHFLACHWLTSLRIYSLFNLEKILSL